MTKVDFLDSLYGARDELTRLIAFTTPAAPDDRDGALAIVTLIKKRDQLTWTIEQAIDAELKASLADYEAAARKIDESTAQLRKISATIKGIEDALAVVTEIVSVAVAILTMI